MPTYRVRRSDEADLKALLRLQQQFYLEDSIVLDEPQRQQGIERLLADHSLGGLWLAADDSSEVGYVALCYGFSLALGGRDAFIDEIFVEPEHRGRGVGRTLLEEAVKAAKAAGVRALHLEVEDGNAGARQLYRKLGFELRRYRLMTRPG